MFETPLVYTETKKRILLLKKGVVAGEVAKLMQLPALPEDQVSSEGTRLSSGAQTRIQTNIHTYKISQYFLKLFLKCLVIKVFFCNSVTISLDM